MLIGYFTLFDLGVSGALTRLVSERISSGRQEELPELVWTALGLATGMGVAGALLVASAAPWLSGTVLRVPAALQRETLQLIWVLAASLPVVTCTAALSGVLAAQQRFGVLNAIRVPMGILSYVAPLVAFHVSPTLFSMALALAATRLLGAAAHVSACLRGLPGLARNIRFRRGHVRPILHFGGWMTVTAVVGPLMIYLDRFVIGATLSMAMVAYYTTPYDLTARLAILTIPVSNVLFPAFAACYDSDPARAGRLFDWGIRAVALLVFPGAFLLAVFPGELLTLWLGPAFAAHSAGVLRLLALGMFLNAIAQVALSLVQSSGRPDLGAKLHVAELPFYLMLVFLLIDRLGILGAAIAWLARVAVDALALMALAHGRVRSEARGVSSALLASILGLVLMVAGSLLPGVASRVAFSALALAFLAVMGWVHVARPGLRLLDFPLSRGSV